MRTVDPLLWSRSLKRRQLQLARPLRFGRRGDFEARFRGSLRDAIAEFWRNCSVEGVRRIVSEDTTPCERYRWILLLTISLMAGSLTLTLNLMNFVTEPPLVISLQNAQHSIKVLPFPAVALCSFNIVSRRRLDAISALVVSVDQNRTYSYAAIRRNLLDSGALLTLALPKVDLQFAHYLTRIGNDQKMNVTALMLELSPACEDVLQRCSWAGRVKPCENLFSKRITSVGVCCVFNGRFEDYDRHTPPKILTRVGHDNGLSVIISEDVEDFAYARKPTIGIEVLIFDGTEYPFLEGGSVRTQLAPPETSTNYAISTRAQAVSPGIVYYSEAWRGCRISKDPTHAGRSYSWCLLECRRYAALQLCGCVPFSLQPRHEQVCTLNELNCLNKHREKFLYYHPQGYTLEDPDGEALSEELQDALFCSECRADCARPVYHVSPTYAPYQGRQLSLLPNKFFQGLVKANTSVLRFFYSSEDQYLYSVMSNWDWYETIGLISSQLVILLGISLVSVFELVFYCTVRWRHHYVRRKRLRLRVEARSDIC